VQLFIYLFLNVFHKPMLRRELVDDRDLHTSRYAVQLENWNVANSAVHIAKFRADLIAHETRY
jgi:hypothetical protein